MLGLLGLRIFGATAADIADLGEEHGHRVLRVCGKGAKVVLVPRPPAVDRAIDRAAGSRERGADLAEHPRHPNGPARPPAGSDRGSVPRQISRPALTSLTWAGLFDRQTILVSRTA
jgi:hypothetical protein